MSFNITASRLRHVVNILTPALPGETDDYGDPLPPSMLIENMFCEVQVKSGDQNSAYSTEVTSEVITVLCWYDDRITNEQYIEWNGNQYIIRHTRNSTDRNGMIITAMRESK
jgi:hypothetical protein